MKVRQSKKKKKIFANNRVQFSIRFQNMVLRRNSTVDVSLKNCKNFHKKFFYLYDCLENSQFIPYIKDMNDMNDMILIWMRYYIYIFSRLLTISCIHRKIFKVCLAILQYYAWKG